MKFYEKKIGFNNLKPLFSSKRQFYQRLPVNTHLNRIFIL
jgi:hypothetical protein